MIPRRLDKYLADATPLSRRQIKRAWEADRVHVELPQDVPLNDGDHRLWSLIFGDDRVFLDGEAVTIEPARQYFALHKPAGILSTTSNPQGRPCLAPYLADLPAAVFPVGRLDEPTTGFLLITDDGDLCFCLLRPRFHVEKEYHLSLAHPLTDDDERLDALREGIDIGDNKPPAVALETSVVHSSHSTSLLSVVVDEGRHRMVRRMARRAGLHLEHLHRPRIGPIELGEIPPGEIRRLTDGEVDHLWDACGGRAAARKRQIAALKRQATRWREEGQPHLRLEAWLEERQNHY